MPEPSAKTLVITTHRDVYAQGRLGDEIAQLLDQAVDCAQFDEIEFVISDSIELYWRGTELGSYEKVIMYGGVSRLLRITHPLAVALKSRGINTYTSGAENFKGLDKLSQNVLFSSNGVPIPKTYFASPENLIANTRKVIGFPCILKDILASQGERNYLIQNQRELEERECDMSENRYIIQQFIPNDGDLRVLIDSGGRHIAFKRIAATGSHLNNISAGGSASLLETTPDEILKNCQKIIAAMNMPLLGIDIIDSESGDHFVLEANTQPQIFTGALVGKKREFFEQLIT